MILIKTFNIFALHIFCKAYFWPVGVRRKVSYSCDFLKLGTLQQHNEKS